MNRFFRKLPLSVKLLLIGLLPFIFLIYLSFQLYKERAATIRLLETYINRVNESANIHSLIDELQNERRYSFIYTMKKERPPVLYIQRARTDSIMKVLQNSKNVALEGFPSYTFLNDLPAIRAAIDTISNLGSDVVMTYYTNAIFRLSTLNPLPMEPSAFLQPVYKDLVGQKLLTQMITFLGIIRANIYNVLYSEQNAIGTLYGLRGTYDIYKTYEIEFLVKASPIATREYDSIRNYSTLKPVIEYLEERFKTFSFDSSFQAETWWDESGKAVNALENLQRQLRNRTNAELNNIYDKELQHKDRTFIFLMITLMLVVGIIVYTIHSITQMLDELKINAQAISQGISGFKPGIFSRDVIGDLAQSISEIDKNNKYIAHAADNIGNGNFNVSINPRSKEDILGNAIVRMKDNLQHFTRVNEESRIQFQQLAEKYKTIFYKAPLPKWIYETKTLKFLEVNEAAVKHYGYSQDEFLNMTIKDIRPIEEEEEFNQHLKKVSSGTETTKSTWRHVKKNGKVITVEITAHPIMYNDQLARLVVINDITERIKAEKSLRQHEETNRLIMSSSLDAIICMDIFGKITFWNPQAEKIFGWKSGDIEGKHLANTIIPPQYREQHRKGLANYLVTGEGPVLNRIIEISAMDKAGNEFPIELAIIPIQQDETTFFCGFIRDISERKKAEEQLSGERNLLRSLIDNLPDYIYVKDKETHYIINNKAFVKLVGADSEIETTGKKVTDFFEEEVGRINMEEDRNVLTLGTAIIDRDEPIVTYKGEKRWLLTTKVPLKDKEERVIGILGISKDITERKHAEEELKQSREDLRLLAAHIEQVREDERISIAREIHDELGQQLTVLKMDISWLHKKLPDSNKIAKEKTQHLLKMLENTVKTVRKISSELRPSMLDDLGLLAALEWQSQEFSKRSGIKTVFSSEIGNHKFSQNIATGLFRIFQESLTNVARHADATKVKSSLQMKNGNIVLQIEDNGKGFIIASIENNKTLGILGMRERTHMMGGEYNIKSTPGKGTIVEVIVPTGNAN